MKIYLASRFKTVQSVNALADTLKSQGHDVVSTWHDSEAVYQPYVKHTDGIHAPTRDLARKDLMEIHNCDAMIVFSEDCEETPGGVWFEAGYAAGLGKATFIIGPRHNIFCHLLPDWPSHEYHRSF